MKNTIQILIFAGLSATLCSCASHHRLVNISPFGESSHIPDPNRINGWPLVYHTGDATSLLWPLIDWDDKGFAVRPVISKHGQDWSVLFPASAWNAATNEGWIGPIYHYDENSGVFPLVNRGEEWNHVGPCWWTDGRAHGVFPLYGWGDDLHHVGPAWWSADDEKAGLFPLYHHDRSHGIGDYYLLQGLLAGLDHSDHEKTTEWIIPVWYRHRDEQESTALLFPLVLNRRDGNKRLILTPLGGRGWDASGETHLLNIAGPLYHYHESDEHSFHAFLWPIFTVSDGMTWQLWPLIAYRGEQGRKGLLHDFAALRIENTSRREAIRLLSPFGFSHRRTKRTDGKPDWQTEFLLFFRFWHNELADREVPLSSRPEWRSMTTREGTHGAIAYRDRYTYRIWNPDILNQNEMKTLRTWRRQARDGHETSENLRRQIAELLQRHGIAPESTRDDALLDALRSLASQHTTEVERVRWGIPLIYRHSRLQDESDWSVLFGLARGERKADRSSLKVLQYLYSRERKGDTLRRDFFPFVVWDSDTDKTRLSFLWRLFNYRRTPEGVGGHILFVPWGTD